MSILYSREQDGTLNVMVAGKVTRDPELKRGNNGDKVRFSVVYGKSKFMNCEAWADSSVGEVAGCLENDDHVIVMGTHRSWNYNGKTYSSLSADFITTLALSLQPAVEAPASASVARSTVQDGAVRVETDNKWEELDDDSGELPF